MDCTTLATQLGLPNSKTHNVANVHATFLQRPQDVAVNVFTRPISNRRATTNTEAIEPLSPLPKIAVRPSPGKGSGLFAVDRIPAYTKIVEDDALISLAEGEDLPDLWKKYSSLPPDGRRRFDNLTYPLNNAEKESTLIAKLKQQGYDRIEAFNMARVNSRWQANAYNHQGLRPGLHWSYGLYPTVAKINHSCTPNAHAHFRPSATQEHVYALRDIEAGEEIEISYFDITLPWTQRQGRAQSWGFNCRCAACAIGGQLSLTNYESRLQVVHTHVWLASNIPNPSAHIGGTHTAIETAQSGRYPWLVASLPRLYRVLMVLRTRTDYSMELVREAARSALEWEEKITGPGSPDSKKRRKQLAIT